MSEWSRLFLETGGRRQGGLRSYYGWAVVEEMQCVLAGPGSHPDSLSGAGGKRHVGLSLAAQWLPGQKTEENNQVS